EARQERHPWLYRLQVLLLALFGFGVLFMGVGGAVIGCLLLIVAVVLSPARWVMLKLGVKLVIPLLLFVGGIIKAVFVRIPVPEGLQLTQENSPKLFRCLEELRKELRVGSIHRVLLVGDNNAGVVEVPRWLMLGSRRYLLVGLPLMRSLSTDEFRSVLAHELGHLSRRHAGFGAWIYRVRHSWSYLHQELEERGGGAVVGWFLSRYAPFFNAYTFVLGRAQEYEADAASARLVGNQTAARALIRGELRQRHLQENFWEFLDDRVKVQPEPPGDLHQVMAQVIKRPLGAQAQLWLQEALAERTTCADTHPSLQDRLKALGVAPEVPTDIAANAAEDLLVPEKVAELQHYLSDQWKFDNLVEWGHRHQEYLRGRARLEALETLAQTRELNDDELYERADLIEDHRTRDEAIVLMRDVVARDPKHIGALLGLGRMLLLSEQDEGERWLRDAMALDPVAASIASRMLMAWHTKHGRSGEVENLGETLKHADAHMAAMQRERSVWLIADTLLPPELPHDVMASLTSAIAEHPGVSEAVIVRKRTRYRTDDPVHVLAVRGVGEDVIPHLVHVMESFELDGLVELCGDRDVRFEAAAKVAGARLR
ncbi:MAG: M48 family metalloprotease, partial [Myxococcales bacterium]|nr:M48 family metalloprotease [Myxococcales bacterium]